MKKGLLLTLLTLALAVPLQAQQQRDRHQSYLSYDEGGTIVRSGEDGKEIDAQRNLPIYPGDEIITARRGRAEVRLSDGNIVGIDRATSLRFRSILDNYEGEANETIAELKYGKVAVQRTDIGRDHVRLDTDNASYVANNEAIYSVETDSRGRDRVTVFAGSVEVRTQSRASRLRSGESASVDDRGPFDLVGDQRYSADDFERWFLKRAERFGSYTSRYLDRRQSYWNDDLDEYGRWVNVGGIGWSWRPYVSVGWRPYYNGYWYRRHGCLTWVSYDPWGWGTYHYGRWAYDPFYGWVWVPGYGYSPAWVYWWYGSNYVGWAPSGWWDCHRGYYDWAYRPYRHTGVNIGFGFYGRVRVNDMDLRPWTFIDSNTIASTRVDRAALTTDAIKQRLGRGGNGGYATVSGSPARFVNDKLRDPAEEIRRRGLGGDSGIEAGTPADLTGYFRRDGNISADVRDRIVRSRGTSPAPSTGTPSRTIGGGSLAPISGGSPAPIRGGSVAPIDGGSNRGSDGRINRGGDGSNEGGTRIPVRTIGGGEGRDRDTSGDNNSNDRPTWRSRGGTEPTVTPREPSTSTPEPSREPSRGSDDSWRRRIREPEPASPPPSSGTPDTTTRDSGGSSSDVPRRVIDRIGGARIYPRDGGDSGSRDSGSSGSRDSGSRDRSPSRDSGSRDSGSHDSGGSRVHDSGSSGRSSSPPPPPPPSSSNNNSGNRESGGKIKRDQ